jgi:hypothetical protein
MWVILRRDDVSLPPEGERHHRHVAGFAAKAASIVSSDKASISRRRPMSGPTLAVDRRPEVDVAIIAADDARIPLNPAWEGERDHPICAAKHR